MVVTTENKLLANYQLPSGVGHIKNPILEENALKLRKKFGSSTTLLQQRSLLSQTKNTLLEKLSQDATGKTESSWIKNTILDGYDKSVLKSKVTSLKVSSKSSTENKLKAELSGKASTVRAPLRTLKNPLLQKHKSEKLRLTSQKLSRNSVLSLHTRNTLLAPSFSLGRSVPSNPSEKIGFQEEQKVPLDSGPKVRSLSVEDFTDVSSLVDNGIDFPSLNEVSQTLDSPTSSLALSKTKLIQHVCSSLINNPVWYSERDETRMKLIQLSSEIANSDPEFVLKVAFYARVELGIRATCNFLLAASSLIPACRTFLKKYFEKAIILPSDWIQVVEFYQSLTEPDGKKNNPSLPAALRKVMVAKFPAFDEYQLAKYNKDKSKNLKKKEKKKEKQQEKKGDEKKGKTKRTKPNAENEKPKMDVHAPNFNLKFLVRKLHLKKPAYAVMCILGKKYPGSVEEFYKCGLEGTWDSSLSGKRMKLAVPETWETQVSAKGNLAKTWEDLLDHRKLPFMAMLRNLRNMIKVGISEKHHAQVLRTLTNERAVIKSKQFPFRFFSAYEVLSELDREIKKQENYKLYGLRYFLDRGLKALMEKKEFARPKTDEEKKLGFIRKSVHKKYSKPFPYDKDLIEKYRKALDKAVSIATINNVPPIPGHTVVICDVTDEMLMRKCTTSKGIGSSRTLAEVGVLLGLMCAYSCEACTFVICSGINYRVIELEKGGILKNLTRIISLANLISRTQQGSGFRPEKLFEEILINRMKMDNLLILSSGLNDFEEQNVSMFLARYKDKVNSKVACFKVNLAGKKTSVTNEPGIMNFSGYSDQILKFIALGSAAAQLNFVDAIDLRHRLVKVDEETVTTDENLPKMFHSPSPLPWKVVRVFISSTIKDMGCERDALVQRVLPILRERAKRLRLHVVETDLRWGITAEDSRYNRSVGICLREVRNCDIFVGILGERYGWMPKDYGFSDEGSEWLEDYPTRRSITELEIVQAAFQDEGRNKPCYFYFRDSKNIKQAIPRSFYDQFFECNSQKQSKLKELKSQILSQYSVMESYAPKCEGIVNGAVKLTDMEEFEQAVLNDLWKELEGFAENSSDAVTMVGKQETSHYLEEDSHIDFALQQPFVGRGMLFSGILRRIRLKHSNAASAIVLVGKSGSGKTALLANVYRNLVEEFKECVVCVHFAHPNIRHSRLIENLLYRFCSAIAKMFDVKDILSPNMGIQSLLGAYSKLRDRFTKSLPMYLLIDNLDSFGDVGFIRNLLQEHVTIIVACFDMGACHKALKLFDGVNIIPVTDLSISDKREIVRSTLGKHSKKLDESHFNNQLQILLSKQQSTSPLYLTNVCDMIRTEESFESLGKTLKDLPHDIHGALKWQLRRAEQRYHNHPGVVASVFGLIHCSSKWKISDTDLHEALCLRFSSGQANGQNISKAFLLSLLNYLRSFLACSDSQSGRMFSISHSTHLLAVEEVFFGTEDFLKSCHGTLADYYTLKLRENWKQVEKDSYSAADAISRLPFHLAHSGRFNILRKLLSDFNYLHYTCTLGLGSKLLEDFGLLDNEVLSKYVRKKDSNISLKPWQEMHVFIKSCIHIVSRYPSIIYQEALNQPKESYPYIVARDVLRKRKKDGTVSLIFFEKTSDSCTEAETLPVQTYEKLFATDLMTCIAADILSGTISFGLQSGKVGIFEKHSGKVLNVWIGHVAEVTALCFIDKSALSSASADGMMSIWNVKEGYRATSFKAHERKVSCVVVRPIAQGTSARIFVSASHDNSIAIWNNSKFKLAARIPTGSPVNCLDFHPHDPRIAAGLWDASIKIWDVHTSRRIAVIRGHSFAVSSVRYSGCGNYVASCSKFETIVRLWASSTGIPLGNFGEAYLTSPRALTFSHGGEYLIGTGEGLNENIAQIAVWNSKLGREELQYQVSHAEQYGNALCCKFNVAKRLLAVGFHEGYISVYDSRLPSAVFTEKIHDSAVTCISWTPGSIMDSDLFLFFSPETSPELVITGSMDQTLKAVDVESGLVVAVLKGHTAPVLSVDTTFQWIASGGEDFSILLWKTTDLNRSKSGMKQHALFGNVDFFVQSNITSNMSNSGSRPLTTVKPVKALHAHEGPVSCMAFNSVGTSLVSGDRGGKIAYWHIQDLTQQQSNAFQAQRHNTSAQAKEMSPYFTVNHAHMDWINCCSWNDTSDHIVTGSNDTTLKVWKTPKLPLLDGGREYKVPVHVLKGHTAGIASVVYKMGCIASAGGEDNSVKIWSHKGVEITELKGVARTNCCDIAIRTEDSEEDSKDLLMTAEEEKMEVEWANEVEAEEWKEEHQKQKPGSKMKRKTLSSEMQNINVVCARNDAKVELWRPLAGKNVSIMNEQAQSVDHVQVSGKGQIISASTSGRLKLWNVKSSGNVGRQNGEVSGIVVFEDVVVTTCNAGFVYVWEKTGDAFLKLANQAKIHRKQITSVCALQNNTFATACNDKNVAVWSIDIVQDEKNENIQEVKVKEMSKTNFDHPVISLTHERTENNKRTLVVGLVDGTSAVITLDESFVVQSVVKSPETVPYRHVLLGHISESKKFISDKGFISGDEKLSLDDLEFVRCFAFIGGTSASKNLLIGTSLGFLCCTADGTKTKMHDGAITVILDSVSTILTASHDCTIKIWSKPTLVQVGQYYTTSPVTCAQFLSDSNLLVGDSSGMIHSLTLHMIA